MLVSACAACGKPRPIALGLEGPVTCVSCGALAELSAAERSALTAAKQALFNAPLRQRQLLAGDRFVFALGTIRHRLAVVFAALAVPLGILAIFGIIALIDLVSHPHDPAKAPAWVYLPVLLVPFALLAILGGRIRRRFRDATVATLTELSARPQGKGGKLTCRMCGGPLPKVDLDKQVCRCAFCSSDNLVDSAIVARAARVEVGKYAGVEEDVLLRADSSTTNITWRAFALLAVPPVAAIVLLIGGLAADRWLSAMHLPVNETLRYERIACPREVAPGNVVSFVIFSREGTFDGDRCWIPKALAQQLAVEGKDDYGSIVVPAWKSALALQTLVGRDVGEWGSSQDPVPKPEVWNPVRIVAVSSDGFGRNWLDGERLGKSVRVDPRLKCFVGPWPPAP